MAFSDVKDGNRALSSAAVICDELSTFGVRSPTVSMVRRGLFVDCGRPSWTFVSIVASRGEAIRDRDVRDGSLLCFNTDETPGMA